MHKLEAMSSVYRRKNGCILKTVQGEDSNTENKRNNHSDEFLNTYNTSGTQDLTSNSKDKDEQICVSVPVDSESEGLISVTTYSAH